MNKFIFFAFLFISSAAWARQKEWAFSPPGQQTGKPLISPVSPGFRGEASSLFHPARHITANPVPSIEWQKCYGGNNGDYAWSIEATADGGYITAGYTEGKDNADVMGYHGNLAIGDIWVVKLDHRGNIQWQKCLGGNYFETGTDIHPTADGGYILAGTAASIDCSITGNHGGADYWVVKLNSAGDIVWQKLYGGSLNEYAYGISMTADGGYVVAGETESSDGDITINHGGRDFWVIKIDASGSLLWQKSLGGSRDDQAYGVRATPDGGCVVAGNEASADGDVTGNHGNLDVWVVKLDNTGNVQWQKALGGSKSDGGYSVDLTQDGGYVVAGYADSNDGDVSGIHNLFPGASDFWVVKLSSSGSLLWQKCYGGDDNEIAYHIEPAQDGGFLVAGSSESTNGDLNCNGGLTDMWVLKISPAGDLLWQMNMGGSYYDEAHCIRELADGSYIIAGTTCSKEVSGFHPQTNQGSCDDFWVVKLTAPLASPPAPAVTIDPFSVNGCAGAPTTLQATALYAGTNPAFSWTRNGLPVGNGSAYYSASDFSNNDQVTCTVTAGGVCENMTGQGTASATVNISNAFIHPVITISADDTVICTCTSITFRAAVQNAGQTPLYEWKVNGNYAASHTSTFITNTLQPGDQVTCIYSDSSSCVTGVSVVSNTITLTSGAGITPSVQVAASRDSVCAGTKILFTALASNAGPHPTYQWRVNNAVAGTNSDSLVLSSLASGDAVNCSLTPDPLFGCAPSGVVTSNILVMTIFNQVFAALSIQASQDTLCTGTPAVFAASVSHVGSNPSYHWLVNGVPAGTNSPSFTDGLPSSHDTVSCLVLVDPSFGCVVHDSALSNHIVLTVINQQPASVDISVAGNNACLGDTLVFTAHGSNAGNAPVYNWMVNGSRTGVQGPVWSTSSLRGGDLVFCQLQPGSGACSSLPDSSNLITALINDTPSVHIFPPDTVVVRGGVVQFRPQVSGTVSSYIWSPSSSLANPLLLNASTIPLHNDMIYTLTVISDKGCRGVGKAAVRIFTSLYMPNAFTPNGDGVNDQFRIPARTTIQLKEFSIYNRWGELVFTTSQAAQGWDGTYQGKKQNTGVYIYVIRGATINGDISVKGHVMLIR